MNKIQGDAKSVRVSTCLSYWDSCNSYHEIYCMKKMICNSRKDCMNQKDNSQVLLKGPGRIVQLGTLGMLSFLLENRCRCRMGQAEIEWMGRCVLLDMKYKMEPVETINSE